MSLEESSRGRGRPPGSKNKPKKRPLAWSFWVGACLVVASVAVFGYLKADPKTLAVAAPTLLVLTGLTQIDRFRRIKGAGFEAEMIAEAREVTKEAQATIVDLRKVALALSRVSLEALTNRGRLGGDGVAEDQRRYVREVTDALTRIGCRRTDIDEIIGAIAAKWRYDLAGSAVNAIVRALQEKHGDPAQQKPEVKASIDLLVSMLGETYDDAPEPDRLRAFAEKHGLDTPEVEKVLLACERFKP